MAMSTYIPIRFPLFLLASLQRSRPRLLCPLRLKLTANVHRFDGVRALRLLAQVRA